MRIRLRGRYSHFGTIHKAENAPQRSWKSEFKAYTCEFPIDVCAVAKSPIRALDATAIADRFSRRAVGVMGAYLLYGKEVVT